MAGSGESQWLRSVIHSSRAPRSKGDTRMDGAQIVRAAGSFFDEFIVAFSSFDGAEIARRYRSPYLALHADGSVHCFAVHADIARYFQAVVDDYHSKGCRSCRYRDLEVVALGTRSALATVTWDLLREDGTSMVSWRESYNLTLVGELFRVVASVDHAA
jgi:hypothetical protein